MVNWLVGLTVPAAYLGILLGTLYAFSTLYRKRKIARAASLEPWFGPHVTRDIYLSLLHKEPAAGEPKVPDSILKAALLRRAAEDIQRIVQIRQAKQALSTLLQRGSVGDDLWKRFQRAEKEIEEELRDVVQEANALVPAQGQIPPWGQYIFQSASEMVQNEISRKRLDELQDTIPAEKEWWDKKRATVQSEFMKELEEEAASKDAIPKTPGSTTSSSDGPVLVEAGGPTDTPGSKGKKKGKK